MVELESRPEGVILPVRAQPGARVSGIRGEAAGALKVSVTTAAEKGKANKALLQVLAKGLGLRRSQLQLISGEASREKRFLVCDVTCEQLRQQIETVLAQLPRRKNP